ncbi:MAG TPA: tRNA lysidine(34) synthetase TilS [Pyrinomonadaceae bacterium]|nr:tRNA lysidine(34) synthetase TilS [Pyrinomonadaceae bacterium]
MKEEVSRKDVKAQGRLSEFARRLRQEWRRRGWRESGGRVVCAVSGGADSTALLLGLAELLQTGRLAFDVTVAHLDHELRGERAREDAAWVEALARELGFESVIGRASVEASARERKDNLEQAARRTRYRFLSETARERGAWAVVVGHTSDDQAETLLLRLVRGSGAQGLAGMRAERVLDEGEGPEARPDDDEEEDASHHPSRSPVWLLRPLLGWARRAETQKYCAARGVACRVDEMNEDERFARVRVRRRLLPLLETFNPRVVEALVRASEILADDSQAIDEAAAHLLEAARAEPVASESVGAQAWPLRVEALSGASAGLRRRALRLWMARGRGDLRRVEMAHVAAVERLLTGERGGRVAELPGGSRVERRRGRLVFHGKRVEKGTHGI